MTDRVHVVASFETLEQMIEAMRLSSGWIRVDEADLVVMLKTYPREPSEAIIDAMVKGFLNTSWTRPTEGQKARPMTEADLSPSERASLRIDLSYAYSALVEAIRVR